jgi:hypothetical protein
LTESGTPLSVSPLSEVMLPFASYVKVVLMLPLMDVTPRGPALQ